MALQHQYSFTQIEPAKACHVILDTAFGKKIFRIFEGDNDKPLLIMPACILLSPQERKEILEQYEIHRQEFESKNKNLNFKEVPR